MTEVENGAPLGELPATEKQRHALYRWGVDRERADDPALSRGEASRWLGALIAQARPRNGGSPPVPEQKGREESIPSAAPPATPGNGTESVPPASPNAGDRNEPTALEIELGVPTPVPYSTIKLRVSAGRRPSESLQELADRLTEELLGIAHEERRKVAASFRANGRPDPAPPL